MTTEVLPDLRARLVRRARRMGADAVSAEDLAQEALAEGWRLRDRLTDPAGIERWHYAILRNVYLRWAARRDEVAPVADRADDGVDVEVELERRELAELLDRALGVLPPQTREVLVRRFVEESPIREVAERLGLSEGAVQMRLARGKLALRQALATDEAAAYGLIAADEVGWQQTPIWCPGCGAARLEGRFSRGGHRLETRCPDCPGQMSLNENVAGFGPSGFRVALRRVSVFCHDFWRDDIRGWQEHPHPLLLRRSDLLGVHHMHLSCSACNLQFGQSLDSAALCAPEGQRFWREHPRIRRVAYQELESGGVPAVLTSYQAVNSAARLDAVLSRDTFRVIRIGRS